MGKKQRQMKKAAAKAAAAIASLENVLVQGSSKNYNVPANVTDGANNSKGERVQLTGSKKKLASDDSTSTESCGSSESDNELMPALEDCNDENGNEATAGDTETSAFPQQLVNIIKQSRGEKKARRLLQKLDLKPVEGVSRVAMRKSKNILLYIDNPDVFKCPHSDTYIFFGEVKVDDMTTRAQVAAAEKFKSLDTGASTSKDSKNKGESESAKLSDDEENYDAGELDEKDIELVMMQANTTRSKAVQALQENDNDVVNAIMALTMV